MRTGALLVVVSEPAARRGVPSLRSGRAHTARRRQATPCRART